ncbi:MAG TPA: OB-fold nucleic acid binding domain-containing protein [Candidatus Nanoarchaeia archaeon]|nr:OB-fold nucleic acid binding domain-containing protein [Candidatus Nanoarchaeia archaeon]
MQEKTVLKIAVVTLLLGFSFLLLYAGDVAIPTTASLDGLPPQEEVKIAGVVQRLSRQENVLFLTVDGQRTETLEIVAFPKEELYLQEGDFVEIQGLIEEYKGKKEVIADSIRKVSKN